MERQIGAITFIPGDNRARYPHCNSIYIETAGLIIDPASNRDHIRRLSVDGSIQTVCLSHWHEDHFKDIDLLEKKCLWASEIDATPLTDMEIYLKWYGVAHPEGALLRRMLRPQLIDQFHFKPRTPDRFLTHGERIDLGKVTMEVLHTPGHSPGHLAFLFVEPGILFLGDYTLDKFGPWYGDPFASLEQTIQSVKCLSKIPANIWITSHGKGLFEDIPGNIWEDYLNAIQIRDEKLLAFLKNPRTLKEIVNKWFILGQPKEPTDYERFGEQAHVQKHLDRLLSKGLIGAYEERFQSVA